MVTAGMVAPKAIVDIPVGKWVEFADGDRYLSVSA